MGISVGKKGLPGLRFPFVSLFCSCSGAANIILLTDGDDTLEVTIMDKIREFETDPLKIACPDPTNTMTLESFTCATYLADGSDSVYLQTDRSSIYEALLVDTPSGETNGSQFYQVDVELKCS